MLLLLARSIIRHPLSLLTMLVRSSRRRGFAFAAIPSDQRLMVRWQLQEVGQKLVSRCVASSSSTCCKITHVIITQHRLLLADLMAVVEPTLSDGVVVCCGCCARQVSIFRSNFPFTEV
jgi:hypothetical protein